jgi:hypothetical protein
MNVANCKSAKTAQNKSIINLKSINGESEISSKMNSPRKPEGGSRNTGFFSETPGMIGSPMRRSVKDAESASDNLTSPLVSDSFKQSERDMRFNLIRNLIKTDNLSD